MALSVPKKISNVDKYLTMRINDILSEAAINLENFEARNPNYWRNLINLIKNKQPVTLRLKKGTGIPDEVIDVTFPTSVANQLEKIWSPTGIDPKEVATPEQVAQMQTFRMTDSDGTVYKLNQVEKTKDIKQKIGAEGKESNSKWWNKGNVAEGIMSCAVITKFENPNKHLQGQDVLKTVQKITEGNYLTKSFGKKLQLRIVLSRNDYRALEMSAKEVQEFSKFENSSEIYKLYDDCATYVNDSSNVFTAMEKIQKASSDDVIEVTADGATAEAQHSTKADLWIALGGKKERLLSIKTATVKHIGAVSGYEFDHVDKFFRSVVNFDLPDEFRKKFKKAPPTQYLLGPDGKADKTQPNPEYVKMSKAERSATIKTAMEHNYAALKAVYTWVYKEINRRLKGDKTKGEYNFVTEVTGGVVHHATLGEDIRVVVISPSAKKAYTELHFGPELYKALESYDLVPVLDVEKTNYKLLVYGYPKDQKAKRVNNDKSMFVQMRSYLQDGAARNVVEIGGLLKDLADVQKLEAPQAPQATPTPKVVATPAKTTPAKTTTTAKTAPATPATAQQTVAEPDVQAANDIDNTEYRYSAESVRPKRGIAETRRQRR